MDATFGIDMSTLYARFLKHLKPNSRILDAGCGPGRDALTFKKMGHHVTAFDASPTMVGIASKVLSQPVFHCTFQEIGFQEEFDAVWACASLLHVPKKELPGTFAKLSSTLVQGGILYASFKYGSGERISDDGRFFTDLNEEELHEIVTRCENIEYFDMWIINDYKCEKNDIKWINTIFFKN